jgi:hypothetical protein
VATLATRRSGTSTTVTDSRHDAIARLTERWRRARGGRSYEPFDVLHEIPISIVFGRERATHLFLVTKDTLLRRLYDELHSFPSGWVIASRAGIPGPAHGAELASLSRRVSRPVQFVGDISPFDVHVFLEYRGLLARSGAQATWAGIGGAWLKRCQHRSGSFIELSASERRHRDELEKRLPELPRIVGADVWAILQNGQKLTLEAASGAPAHGEGVHRFIVRSLSAVGSGGVTRIRQEPRRRRG